MDLVDRMIADSVVAVAVDSIAAVAGSAVVVPGGGTVAEGGPIGLEAVVPIAHQEEIRILLEEDHTRPDGGNDHRDHDLALDTWCC